MTRAAIHCLSVREWRRLQRLRDLLHLGLSLLGDAMERRLGRQETEIERLRAQIEDERADLDEIRRRGSQCVQDRDEARTWAAGWERRARAAEGAEERLRGERDEARTWAAGWERRARAAEGAEERLRGERDEARAEVARLARPRGFSEEE